MAARLLQEDVALVRAGGAAAEAAVLQQAPQHHPGPASNLEHILAWDDNSGSVRGMSVRSALQIARKSNGRWVEILSVPAPRQAKGPGSSPRVRTRAELWKVAAEQGLEDRVFAPGLEPCDDARAGTVVQCVRDVVRVGERRRRRSGGG
jgi:hypothetical protein